MSTLQEKRERIKELQRAQRELAEEELRLWLEIAKESCPFKEGDRFEVYSMYRRGVWEVRYIGTYRREWVVEASRVKKDGTVDKRTTRFHVWDLCDINLKPLEATT